MIRRVSITAGVAAAVFIIAIVAFLSVVKSQQAKEHERYTSLLIKPEMIANVADLLRLKPEVRDVFSVTNENSISLVVTLQPPKGTSHIYSGPPAYIFDEEGRFIQWSVDIGDDTKFWRTWPISRTNKIANERLQEFVEPSASPEPPPRDSD